MRQNIAGDWGWLKLILKIDISQLRSRDAINGYNIISARPAHSGEEKNVVMI